MTKRDSDLLKFISRFQKKHGYTPSFEEMRAGLGLASKSAIAAAISSLERDGYIGRVIGRKRAITVLMDVNGRPTGAVPPVRAVSP